MRANTLPRFSFLLVWGVATAACALGRTAAPHTSTAPAILPAATPAPPPTPAAAVSVPASPTRPTLSLSPTPTVELPPPQQPLRAWSVAPDDGAVFVLDAAGRIYRLSPVSLTPQALSNALLPATADSETYLLASQEYLFAGSQSQSQTLVLNRQTLEPVAALDKAGPMALDPGQQLFLIADWTIWAYSLADLTTPPRQVAINPAYNPGLAYGAVPQTLAVDSAHRRLYAGFYNQYGSPPHNPDSYRLFNLDTLAQLGEFNIQQGDLSRPAIALEAGLLFSTLAAKSGPQDNRLIVLNQQGKELDSRPLLSGLPLTDPAADWLYLLRPRGLWTLSGRDLSLQSIRPFTSTPPLDAALSPDAAVLYLFGRNRVQAVPVDDLHRPHIPVLTPFPAAWLKRDPNIPNVYRGRLYTSPQMARDAALFLQWGFFTPHSGLPLETYRSEDHGQSWQFLVDLTYPQPVSLLQLSLSPNFSRDRTLVARTPDGLLRSTDAGSTWQDWSSPVAFTSDRSGNRDIYLMGQDGGNPRPLAAGPADEETPAWSPAWTYLAFASNRNGNWDIFSLRANCACNLRQLTDHLADDLLPAWSPDGRWIAFVSLRDGNPEIYLMDAGGQNQRRLTFNPTGDWRPAWLPNSRGLLFTSNRGGNNDIYRLTLPPDNAPLTGEPEIVPLTTDPADDRDPAVSADGKMVFLSNRQGTMRAYTLDLKDPYAVPYPFTGQPRPESHPAWVDDQGFAILAVLEGEAGANIYRLMYAADPQPLTTSPGFNGHPAWGPVWWDPPGIESLPAD